MKKVPNIPFGVAPSVEDEKIAFVKRASYFLQELRRQYLQEERYRPLFNTICVGLGLNPREVIDNSSLLRTVVPDLHELIEDDFVGMLKLLSLVRKYFLANDEMRDFLDETFQGLLDKSACDIGIICNAGIFYPKGEELLDKDLINHSLNVLSLYPNEDKDLREALDNYKSNKKTGVIEICYRCVEGLARQILNNNKTLIDNKPLILKRLSLSDHWKKILANYIDYGNEYARHAGPERHATNEAEVEAYLYTTCVLVRLIMRIK